MAGRRKRAAYQARFSSTYIDRRAGRTATREAGLHDHALEAIDEAITRFRADLRATRRVVLADGGIAEEPLLRITPRDLAVLIDRLQVLFGRPSTISEGRGFEAIISSEVPVEVLTRFVELTRGLGPPAPDHSSGLPFRREKRPD